MTPASEPTSRELRSIKILHSMYDSRIDAQTTLLTMTIQDYLRLTKQSEENLAIQRRILPKNKIYTRLQKDLRMGGTIPPIVLAVAEKFQIDHNEDGSPKTESLRHLSDLAIYIVDGLQRTHHMRQVRAQFPAGSLERKAFLSRQIRVELWTNISFPSVLYRMMLLNAAQTPMTLRHQLEVVSLHIVKLIEDEDASIELFTEKSGRRRMGAKQFKTSDIVEAFTAFVKRTPFTEAKSLVVEEIDREDFLEGFNEGKYSSDIAAFISFLMAFDEAVCKRYISEIAELDGDHVVRRGVNFLGTRPYLLGIAAAAGHASSKLELREFRERAVKLVALIRETKGDPLGLNTFNVLLPDLLRSTGKIGDTQREFVFIAFKDYFLDSQDLAFDTYWKAAARRI